MPDVTNRVKLNLVDVAIGLAVRDARIRADLELETCAALVGVAVSQLKDQEEGLARISANQLFRLSKLLKMPMASLYASVRL